MWWCGRHAPHRHIFLGFCDLSKQVVEPDCFQIKMCCVSRANNKPFLPVQVAEGHSGEFDFFHVLNHHGSGGWPAEVVADAAADLPGGSGEAACHHQQPQRPASLAVPLDKVVHTME